MKLNLKEGGIYSITFLDHAQHSGESSGPVMCTCYGRVVWQDEVTVDVVAWETSIEGDKVNRELFTLIKSCVKKARRLR